MEVALRVSEIHSYNLPGILWTLAVLATVLLSSVGRSFGHGAYHDVVAALSVELQRNPNDAALRYKLAEAHAEHEDWRACIREIKLVEQLAPGVYPSDFLRGFALLTAGKYEEAKELLDAFLAGNSRHPQALATRGRVLAKLARPSEAAGNVPSLLLCALEIETQAGAWDDALRRIDGLEKHAPAPEPWMARRAEMLQMAGKGAESLTAWRSLRDRLLSLPSLERGTPTNLTLLNQARSALGESAPPSVTAPPSVATSPTTTSPTTTSPTTISPTTTSPTTTPRNP